jgi:hypothetical protein
MLKSIINFYEASLSSLSMSSPEKRVTWAGKENYTYLNKYLFLFNLIA